MMSTEYLVLFLQQDAVIITEQILYIHTCIYRIIKLKRLIEIDKKWLIN